MRKSLKKRISESVGKGWKMFNPYNEAEVRDVAPTVTCGYHGIDSSSTILIVEENE